MHQIPEYIKVIHNQTVSNQIEIQQTPKLSISEMKLIDVEELKENTNMNKLYIIVQVSQQRREQGILLLVVKDFNEIWLNVTIYGEYNNIKIQEDDWLILKNPQLCETGIIISDCQDVVEINSFTYQSMIQDTNFLLNINSQELKETGNKYFKQEQFYLAYELYTMALEQQQQQQQQSQELTLQCYNNRALCLQSLGYYQESLQDINEVLNINKENKKALFRKGICLLKLKQPIKAKEILESIPEYKLDKDIVFKLVECEMMKKHQKGEIDLINLLTQHLNQNEQKFEKIYSYFHPDLQRKQSKIGGLGLFAKSYIKKGTLLMIDHPMHIINKINDKIIQTENRRDIIISDLRYNALINKTFAENLFSLYDGNNKYNMKKLPKDFSYQLQKYIIDYNRIEKIFQFNAHAFQQLKVFTNNKQIKYIDQSEGLWKSLSQVNHNIYPNICYYFIGELLIVISAKDIKEGDELLIQYHPPMNSKEYQQNLKSHNIPIDQELVKMNHEWKLNENYSILKQIIKKVKKTKNLTELTEYILNNQQILLEIKSQYPIKYLKITQTVCYSLFQQHKIEEYLNMKFESLLFQFNEYPQCSMINDFMMFITVASQQQDIEKNMAKFIFEIGIFLFGQSFLRNQNSEELLFQFGIKYIGQ